MSFAAWLRDGSPSEPVSEAQTIPCEFASGHKEEDLLL